MTYNQEENQKFWFIVPTLRVDKNKYRGRGRPRKSDYHIDTGQDFIVSNRKIDCFLEKNQGYIISIGTS